MSEGGPLPRQQGPALNPSVLGQGAHCSPVGGASEKNGGRTRVWRVFPSDFSSAVSFLKILACHLVSDHCNYHCDPGAALSSTVQLPGAHVAFEMFSGLQTDISKDMDDF